MGLSWPKKSGASSAPGGPDTKNEICQTGIKDRLGLVDKGRSKMDAHSQDRACGYEVKMKEGFSLANVRRQPLGSRLGRSTKPYSLCSRKRGPTGNKKK